MATTTTIEFEFEYQILIGQLDPHSEISLSSCYSINRFYSEFADRQSDLLEYKDARITATNFRDDLYRAICDTTRKHFARSEYTIIRDISISDFEFDDYVYVNADLETTINAMVHIQIVLYIGDENAFDRNKLFRLVKDRFIKEWRESKYAKNFSLYYEISISDFIER